MGNAQWVDSDAKKGFMETYYAAYLDAKAKGRNGAKNVHLQALLNEVKKRYEELFGADWGPVDLPKLNDDATQEARNAAYNNAIRERLRSYLYNHSLETLDGKRVKNSENVFFTKKKRAPGITVNQAYYQINKAELDAKFTTAFEKHCEGMTESQCKEQRIGFRATFLKESWAGATDEAKEAVRKFIGDKKAKDEEAEVEKYSWPDQETAGEEELKRRHAAMQRVREIKIVQGAIEAFEDRVESSIEGISLSIVGYMNPRKEGKPTFVSSCRGVNVEGKTFAEKHPEAWNQVKDLFATYLANAFSADARARVALPNLSDAAAGRPAEPEESTEDEGAEAEDESAAKQTEERTFVSTEVPPTESVNPDVNDSMGTPGPEDVTFYDDTWTGDGFGTFPDAGGDSTGLAMDAACDMSHGVKPDVDGNECAPQDTTLDEGMLQWLGEDQMIPATANPMVMNTMMLNTMAMNPAHQPQWQGYSFYDPFQSFLPQGVSNSYDQTNLLNMGGYQPLQDPYALQSVAPSNIPLPLPAPPPLPFLQTMEYGGNRDLWMPAPETAGLVPASALSAAAPSVLGNITNYTSPQPAPQATVYDPVNKVVADDIPAATTVEVVPPTHDVANKLAFADQDNPSTGVQSSAAVSTNELLQPKWVKEYHRGTQKLLGGTSEKNDEMAGKALELEKLFLYKPDLAGLPTTNQPPAIRWLVDRGHDYTNAPPVTKLIEGTTNRNAATACRFAEAFLPYYNSLMPSCRKAKGEKLGRRIQPTQFHLWKDICHGGKNGISLLIHRFAWWFKELNPNDDGNDLSSAKYTNAVEDFTWVLDCLLDGARLGLITWMAEEEEADAIRRGRKRGVPTSDAENRKGKLPKKA